MVWKLTIFLGLVWCCVGYEHQHAISYQNLVQHYHPEYYGHHGELSHIGSHVPEHHKEYAWAYPKYEYSYNVNDPHTHDYKGQHEVRDGDTVKGMYWLIQPDGRKRTVTYYADQHHGFNANVEYSDPHHPVHRLPEPPVPLHHLPIPHLPVPYHPEPHHPEPHHPEPHHPLPLLPIPHLPVPHHPVPHYPEPKHPEPHHPVPHYPEPPHPEPHHPVPLPPLHLPPVPYAPIINHPIRYDDKIHHNHLPVQNDGHDRHNYYFKPNYDSQNYYYKH